MRILGVDPSLSDTGWAVMESDGNSGGNEPVLVASGRIRTKAEEFYVVRYARHRDEIAKVLDTYKPDYISMEIPPPNASWSAGLYPIWISMSEEYFKRRIPYVTFLPSQIKVYAREILGDTGKMFKSDMVDAAKLILGAKKRMNHNIADAIIVAWAGLRFKALKDGTLVEGDLTTKEKYLFTRTVTRRATGITEKIGHVYKEGDKYFELTKEKYDPLYIDPKIKAQKVEYSRAISKTARKSLLKEGIKTAADILGLVEGCESEGEACGVLTRFNGVGKKGAAKILAWAKAAPE